MTDGSLPVPGTASAQFSLTVAPAPPLVALTKSVADGTQGESYHQQLAVTGGAGPDTWSVISGSLPAGLSLDAEGAITGTPTAAGTSLFVVDVVDSGMPTPAAASAALSLTVAPGKIDAQLIAAPSSGIAPFASGLVLSVSQANDDDLNYSVDFGDGTTQPGTLISAPYPSVALAHTYQDAGTYVATVTVTDAATGASTTANAAVTVASATSQPPTASLTALPASGVAPLATGLEINASDPAGLPLTYTLDFGDQTPPASGALSGNGVVAHTYQSVGDFAAVLRVSDGRLDTTQVVHIDVAAAAPITASAGDDQLVSEGETVQLDGSGSQPASAIQSYTWDFGDGTKGSGVVAQHSYLTAGTYNATLTVAGSSSSDSSSSTITVVPVVPATGLQVGVTGSGHPLVGAQALIITGSGQRVTGVTDTNGIATLSGLPDGTYTVDVYQPGFVPATVSATVTDSVGSATVDLAKGPVATATVTSTPLSLSQIRAAGIDPTAAANNKVEQFSSNIAIGPQTFTFQGYTCGSSFCGDTTWVGGGGPNTQQCAGGWCIQATTQVVDDQQNIEYLMLPGTAKTLKEFFDVKVLVQSLAPPAFTLDHGSATLQLPDGLSLAPTSTPQRLTQSVSDISGGETASVNWTVRGDVAGDYSLTANYSAALEPFGDPVALTGTSAKPLKVWGASALQMTFDSDATATAGNPYLVRVGLKNVSDVPVYNASVSLSRASDAKWIYQPNQQLTYNAATIMPGETFWTPEYVLVPQVTGALDLGGSFVTQLGGDAGSATEFTTHPAVSNPPSLTALAEKDAVGLKWDPVAGASSYQIFSTPTPLTPFGSTPIATVNASTTKYKVAGLDPAQPGYFTIVSVVSGVATMKHPLVEGLASSTATEPVVTASMSSTGCVAGDVTVTEAITDTFGTLKSYTYTVGSAAPVTLPITGDPETATETFVVPQSAIPAVGVPLTIHATDDAGDGPEYRTQVGGCPTISKITTIPDVANPTIVITGNGFGTDAMTTVSAHDDVDSNYLQIFDRKGKWEAGGTDVATGKPDGCTQIIGYWSPTEIIVKPSVNQGFGHSCNMNPGDTIDVSVWPGGRSDFGRVLTGSTSVVSPVGAAPTLTTLSPAYGPEEGGTFAAPDGVISVSGKNLAQAEAVWFGNNYAAPPVSKSGGSVTVSPPALLNPAGVELQVATPAGYWPQPTFCVMALGCPGTYYYLAQAAGWSGGGSFGPITFSTSQSTGSPAPAVAQTVSQTSSSTNSGGQKGTETGGDPASSTTDGASACSAKAQVSLAAAISGEWHSSGGVYDALNGGVPSAVLASGSLEIPSFSTDVSLGSDISGSCDIPLWGLPVKALQAGLYLHLEGDVKGTLDLQFSMKNLSLNLDGVGWVDGQVVGDVAMECNGVKIGLSNLSALGDCLTITTGVKISGHLEAGPEIRLGPTLPGVEAKVAVGTLLGVGATAGTDAGSAADFCWAPLYIDHDIKIASIVSNSGSGVLPGPVQIYGNDPEQCPFEGANKILGDVTVTATGGAGTVSVSQDLSNPGGPLTFNGSNKYLSVQAVSDPFTAVTINDCDLNGGTSLYWWDGASWQQVSGVMGPSGSPPCLSFTVTDQTTPNLNDLLHADFAVGSGVPLTVTTASLPSATVASPYPATPLAATGGTAPLTWAVTSGALPDGLNLDASTGVISGTPTGVPGTSSFTVSATDSSDTPFIASSNLQIDVAASTKAPTQTSLGASAASILVDQPVTYTATVTSDVAPGGTVSFADGTTPIDTCQSVVLTDTPPYVATCDLTYPATGSHSVTATYSGDDFTGTSASPELTVDVTPQVVPLAVSTASLPDGTVGVDYPATPLSATGGTAPLSWSVSVGSLPDGLDLDTSTGVISGKPTSAGTSTFTVSVTDSAASPATATAELSIDVQSPSAASSSTAIEASASSAVAGQQVTYTATVSSVAVPSGTVSFADAGSPIAACQAQPLSASAPYVATCAITYAATGSHSVTASYSGDLATQGSTSAPVAVGVTEAIAPLTVTTTALPGGIVGQAYPATALSASGGTGPLAWTVSTGALPAGLGLDSSTGAISGTPTTGGTASFTVTATDSETPAVSASADLSIQVAAADSAIELSASETAVSAGSKVTFTASVSSDAVPGGTVSFADTGSPITACQSVPLSSAAPHVATCDVTYEQPAQHSVVATYSGDSSSKQASSSPVTVAVSAAAIPLAVTTSSLPDATAGTGYPATTLSASGGTVPLTWSISTGSLPQGLTLDAATGEISGTPTAVGTSSFTVMVVDSAPSPATATADLSIKVAAAPLSPTTTVVTAFPASPVVGDPITYTATVSSATLPGGTVSFADGGSPIASCQSVALSAATPYVAGCTVTYSVAGPHSVTATYSGDAHTATSASSPLAVSVSNAPFGITNAAQATAAVGQAFSFALTTTGGKHVTFSVVKWRGQTGLPAGIYLQNLANHTGLLKGKARHAGVYTFSILAHATGEQWLAQAFTLTVTPKPLSIVAKNLPIGKAGVKYRTATLRASGGTAPYTWSVSAGSMPPGLQLAAVSGKLSGMPTSAGTFTFTIRVTDSALVASSATAAMSIKVLAAWSATSLSASASSAIAGQSVTYRASVASAAIPHGSVTFLDGKAPVGRCRSVALSAAPPYVANCVVTYPRAGWHVIRALYSGDTGTARSISRDIVISVVSASAFRITSSSCATVRAGTSSASRS